MKMDWKRIAEQLQAGKTVDVSDFTVRQFCILQENLHGYGIQFSKMIDKRNFRMYLANFKDLETLIKEEIKL